MPHSFLIPMVILAGLASIIASQAVIRRIFDFPARASSLDFAAHASRPHLPPLGRSDLSARDELDAVRAGADCRARLPQHRQPPAAYGLAVTGAMCIDTVLFAVCRDGLWKWHKLAAASCGGSLPIIDISLLASTVIKSRMVAGSRWIAAIVLVFMTTWKRGRNLMAEQRQRPRFAAGPMIEALS